MKGLQVCCGTWEHRGENCIKMFPGSARLGQLFASEGKGIDNSLLQTAVLETELGRIWKSLPEVTLQEAKTRG